MLNTRAQCVRHEVAFHFKQTGAVFVKDGRTYRVPRRLQHSQAARAGIDYDPHPERPAPGAPEPVQQLRWPTE